MAVSLSINSTMRSWTCSSSVKASVTATFSLRLSCMTLTIRLVCAKRVSKTRAMHKSKKALKRNCIRPSYWLLRMRKRRLTPKIKKRLTLKWFSIKMIFQTMGSEWGMQYIGTLSISTLNKLRKERSQTGRWFFGVISKSFMACWTRSHQDQSTRMSTLYHLWKLHSSKLCRRQVSVGRAISKITLNQSTGAIELKDCHERNHRSNLKDYLKRSGAY